MLCRLDYCCSTFYGIPDKQTRRIQSIINYALRVVKKPTKRDSVDSALATCGWLRAKQRIIYRLACIVYSTLHNNYPKPLAALLSFRDPPSGMITRNSHDHLQFKIIDSTSNS